MLKFNQCINGKFFNGDGVAVGVLNPASEEVIVEINESSLLQVGEAVAAAKKAFSDWKKTTFEERNGYLEGIATIIDKNKSELAQIITSEQGKPLFLASLEVDAAIGWVKHALSLSLESKVIEDSADRTIEVHYEPLGVVASITPWNWPLMIAIWHIIPAIKAGNTVVIKPSNFTPLSTLLLIELMNHVLPAGVINSVVGDTEVGVALSSHQDINKIVFTGSTPTGQAIMKSAATNLKNLTLELGGNDPAFVLDDVDVDKVAPKIFQTAFLNMGQTCAAIKRLYVHEAIYDELCEKLVAIAQQANIGDGSEADVNFGPIQNAKQLAIVESLVRDAVEHNGTVLHGGKRLNRAGFFYAPTLVSNVSSGVRLVDEEQFGPVLPIIKFSDVELAIQEANKNSNGLGSSIWTNNEALATKLSAQIEAGTTWINNHAEVLPHSPFGGCKMSGLGVEFGDEGFKAYTRMHVINKAK